MQTVTTKLRAGPLEREARRRDVRLDDFLPEHLVEVEPLRSAETLDRPRVVVDEVGLTAVCVTVGLARRFGLRKRTVA